MSELVSDHRRQLIHTLQMAYSGEKAAALAYKGHWHTLRNDVERLAVRKIEEQEWAHREILKDMLTALGAQPQSWREVMMACIGHAISSACYFIGWFMPMYFAGRLESANIEEYERASLHASEIRLLDFAEKLGELATVEAEHELFFMRRVSGHPWLPYFQRAFPWRPYRARWDAVQKFGSL